jgi:DNA-directed RNA polymerase subunit RPC12/RpoP
MEKSRAIELLKLAVPIKALTQQEYSDFIEAINMAIDALKAQLSPEGTTSDLIDRRETIERFNVIRPVDPKKDEYTKGIDVGIAMCVVAVKDQPAIQPVATDIYVGDKISKFIDGLEEIFADLREKHVDDSVCGLCEYDGAYIGQSGDWCNECPGFERDDCFKLSDKTRKKWTDEIIKALPTIQPEPQEGHWIKHETPDGGEQYECSRCGVLWEFNDGTPEDNEAFYCPKCGTKMKGEQDGH